jgi:hypothetical protein
MIETLVFQTAPIVFPSTVRPSSPNRMKVEKLTIEQESPPETTDPWFALCADMLDSMLLLCYNQEQEEESEKVVESDYYAEEESIMDYKPKQKIAHKKSPRRPFQSKPVQFLSDIDKIFRYDDDDSFTNQSRIPSIHRCTTETTASMNSWSWASDENSTHSLYGNIPGRPAKMSVPESRAMKHKRHITDPYLAELELNHQVHSDIYGF